jgi:hypothetical protein
MMGEPPHRVKISARRAGWNRSSGVTVLIISGIRVFFHTTGQGVFHCQLCGSDRHYRRRSGRRYFTLSSKRVLPLSKVGEHVQCLTCRTRYHPNVLELPAPAGQDARAA